MTASDRTRLQVKPAAFDYHAPRTIDEALGLLSQAGGDARILAGGQSLVPAMAARLEGATAARGSVADAQARQRREFKVLALALEQLEARIVTRRSVLIAKVEADTFLFEVCAAVSD